MTPRQPDALYHSRRLLSLWSGAAWRGLTGPQRSILIDRGTCRGGGGRGEYDAARRGRAANGRKPWRANAPAEADTFPKLLVRNARSFGDRPAMRHKDLGIWQTWTWAQVLDEVRAYAVGLHRLGLKRGDTIAIVGANRPKLYWSVMAAQVLGAVPVPVYADAVADELCLCAGARRGALRRGRGPGAGRQDPVGVGAAAEARDAWSTTSRGACATTTTAKLHADRRGDRRRPRGAGARTPRSRAWLDGEIAAGKGSDTSIILYTSGTTGQSKGVVLSAERCIGAGSDTVAFDKLTEQRRGAGLSAARLGRRPLSQLRAGPGRGLLHGLPGERRHRDGRTCARSGRPSTSRRRASSSRC